jgi:hypothetical protein
VGKHSAPKPPMPSAKAIMTGAVGVPAVLFPGLVGATYADAAQPDKSQSEPTRPIAPANARFLPPTDEELARLRFCEASGRYETNTGNGFYGAYQFDAQTWRGLGLGGLPHQASADLQDAAASVLEQSRGWQPWPACSRKLGLLPRRNHGLTIQQVVNARPAKAAAVAKAPTPRKVHAAPAFTGKPLSIASRSTYRSDVRLWQERLAQRGWEITVDGFFGPQTQQVARAFAAEKGIHEGLPGEVGRKLWKAAWALPVHAA